jgi:hypothetical protein
MKKILLFVIAIATSVSIQAQTADEIIDTYLENIGGKEAWSKVTSMKATGLGKQGGVDYPFTATFTKDGKAFISVDLQGTQFIAEAFDGETNWSTNFQTLKPEAKDAESSENYKRTSKDNMPDAFLNYKEKGYKAEFLGKEEFDGTECFKIKLTKKPMLVDGKEEENVETYFFDTENYVPIAMEAVIMTGQGKGAKSQSIFSDYQEVDGLYMPYTNITRVNGQTVFEMSMKTVTFNVEVDESIFKMPEDTTTTDSKKKN